MIFFDGDSLAVPSTPFGMVAREGDGMLVDPNEAQPMLPGTTGIVPVLPTYTLRVDADWADWVECMYVDPAERAETMITALEIGGWL